MSSEGDKLMYDESKHIAVRGWAGMATGHANSMTVFWFADIGDFEAVLPNTTLTITDVLLNPGPNVPLTAPHPVYLSNVWPNGTSEDFFQLQAQPGGATQQAHFLTGHVIEAGHTVLASTVSTPPSGQWGQEMSLWLNGYLPKSWMFWWTKAARTRKPMIRPNVPHLAR
jgi:hypothetical protein